MASSKFGHLSRPLVHVLEAIARGDSVRSRTEGGVLILEQLRGDTRLLDGGSLRQYRVGVGQVVAEQGDIEAFEANTPTDGELRGLRELEDIPGLVPAVGPIGTCRQVALPG